MIFNLNIMVDTISSLKVLTKDVVVVEDHIRLDQLDVTTAITYSNTMSLIKLRQ